MFLTKQFGELKLQTFAIPDHLFGTDAAESKNIKEQMSEIVQKIKQLNEDVDKLAMAIMEQVYPVPRRGFDGVGPDFRTSRRSYLYFPRFSNIWS